MDDKLEQLSQLCQRLGSPEKQARVMASQLLKRAGQLARERGITEPEAMDYLLRLMISAREGNTLPDPPAQAGSSGMVDEKNPEISTD